MIIKRRLAAPPRSTESRLVFGCMPAGGCFRCWRSTLSSLRQGHDLYGHLHQRERAGERQRRTRGGRRSPVHQHLGHADDPRRSSLMASDAVVLTEGSNARHRYDNRMAGCIWNCLKARGRPSGSRRRHHRPDRKKKKKKTKKPPRHGPRCAHRRFRLAVSRLGTPTSQCSLRRAEISRSRPGHSSDRSLTRPPH